MEAGLDFRLLLSLPSAGFIGFINYQTELVFLRFTFIINWMYVSMCVSKCFKKPVRSPGTRAAGGCELPGTGAGNPTPVSPLQDQHILLIAEDLGRFSVFLRFEKNVSMCAYMTLCRLCVCAGDCDG